MADKKYLSKEYKEYVQEVKKELKKLKRNDLANASLTSILIGAYNQGFSAKVTAKAMHEQLPAIEGHCCVCGSKLEDKKRKEINGNVTPGFPNDKESGTF